MRSLSGLCSLLYYLIMNNKKILVWNYQGTSNKRFEVVVKDLIALHKPHLLILVGTWIKREEADKAIKGIMFKSNERTEIVAFLNGIWAFWNKDQMQVKVLKRHRQYMHMKVCYPDECPVFFKAVYESPNPTVREDLGKA